jgi:phosphate transport system substrate-binding protein
VRVSGSTTLLPITLKAVEEYLKENPAEIVTVSGTGTGEGVKSLIDGVVDLAAASRELKPAEEKRAREKGLTLTGHVVARDALAVIVHKDNPVQALTMAQLRGIYLGAIRDWSEVGGEARLITAINRDSSSGTFEMWVEKVLLGQKHRPDAQVQSSSGAVAYAVAGNRHAIGYVGLGFLDGQVKTIAIDGTRATLATVTEGSYAISRPLFIFSRADASSSARRFLGYLLGSEGQGLLAAEGFAPAGD